MAALVLSPYVRQVGRELKSWWGALPVALWVLAAIGMFWSADVTWNDRLRALDDFHRLLAIPFLIAQFRMSPHGRWVLIGFLVFLHRASCSVLSHLFPAVPHLALVP